MNSIFAVQIENNYIIVRLALYLDYTSKSWYKSRLHNFKIWYQTPIFKITYETGVYSKMSYDMLSIYSLCLTMNCNVPIPFSIVMVWPVLWYFFLNQIKRSKHKVNVCTSLSLKSAYIFCIPFKVHLFSKIGMNKNIHCWPRCYLWNKQWLLCFLATPFSRNRR